MSFSDDLSGFAQRTKKTMDDYVRFAVYETMNSLIEKSPVGDPSLWKEKPPKGYQPGNFISNWQLGVDDINYVVTDDKDVSGQVSIDGLGAIPDQASGHLYYITNSLPYAQRLEDGWSTQAPQGMVALTVVEFSVITNKAAQRAKFA